MPDINSCVHCGEVPKNSASGLKLTPIGGEEGFLCISCHKEWEEAEQFLSNAIRGMNDMAPRVFREYIR